MKVNHKEVVICFLNSTEGSSSSVGCHLLEAISGPCHIISAKSFIALHYLCLILHLRVHP